MVEIIASIFLSLSLVLVASHAAELHTVGWSPDANLSVWASDKIFTKGDMLLFRYTAYPGVEVVSQSDYHTCHAKKSLLSYFGGEQAEITLYEPGPVYFICPIYDLCSAGMKLAINVVDHVDKNESHGDIVYPLHAQLNDARAYRVTRRLNGIGCDVGNNAEGKWIGGAVVVGVLLLGFFAYIIWRCFYYEP